MKELIVDNFAGAGGALEGTVRAIRKAVQAAGFPGSARRRNREQRLSGGCGGAGEGKSYKEETVKTFSMREVMKQVNARYRNHVTFQVDEKNEAWMDDSIQFPRLISEIGMVGLTPEQAERICASMDLEREYLGQLFARAAKVWSERVFQYLKKAKKQRKKKR